MTERAIVVRAEWDEEAGVWVATSDDVPGLVTEAETVELLERKLSSMIPELLHLNDALRQRPASVPMNLIAMKRERLALDV